MAGSERQYGLPSVWIVQRNYDYEGFQILGVFANETDAKRYADQVEYRADGIEYDEWPVGLGEVWKPTVPGVTVWKAADHA